MDNFTPVSSLIGGGLIGLAASVYLLFHGRIAGISGIMGTALEKDCEGSRLVRLAFLVGLIGVGVVAGFASSDAFDAGHPLPTWGLVLGGLMVGFGTRLGSGCTSGHGICGLSRGSTRSLGATLTFMGIAAVSTFVTYHLIGVGQ